MSAAHRCAGRSPFPALLTRPQCRGGAKHRTVTSVTSQSLHNPGWECGPVQGVTTRTERGGGQCLGHTACQWAQGGRGPPGRDGGTKVLSGQVEGIGALEGAPPPPPCSFSTIAHLLHFPSFISLGLLSNSPGCSARFFLRSCHPPSPTQGPACLPPSPSGAPWLWPPRAWPGSQAPRRSGQAGLARAQDSPSLSGRARGSGLAGAAPAFGRRERGG